MLLIFSLNHSVGLFVVLGFLFLHRHKFFDILFDLLQNRKLRILNAAHILLDLCLLALNVYNDLMSWFGKDNTGNYYVKIVDCHLFGFLVVDHFDSLCLFFDCIDYFNFVDHSAACW